MLELSANEPKLKFLKTFPSLLKIKTQEKFFTQFQNDKFNAEHEIHEYYENEFKDIILNIVKVSIVAQIKENFLD